MLLVMMSGSMQFQKRIIGAAHLILLKAAKLMSVTSFMAQTHGTRNSSRRFALTILRQIRVWEPLCVMRTPG